MLRRRTARSCATTRRWTDLVPVDAVVEKVADGFTFTEGPVWVPGDPDRLYFSDIPANTVYRWSESEGKVVFLQPVLPEDAAPAAPAARTVWRCTPTAGSSCASTATAGCPRWRSTASG